MARTVAEIQQQIITNVQADTTLSGLTSSSNRAIWRLWTFIVATGIALHEQLFDKHKSDVETLVNAGVPGTAPWLQGMVFKFQYDAVTPQIIQLINLVPQYPTVDTTKCIVTRCSVKTDISNNVKIKVAKANPPTALVSGEVSALQSYINTIGTPGINYTVVSQNADKLYINADIYFQGQYSSVISANVQAAIIAYLASLPFDGSLKLSDLESAILAIEGVNDVVLNNIRARQDSDVFASGSDIVFNGQVISRLWNTIAGYIIPETTTGYTLTDSLNFIAE